MLIWTRPFYPFYYLLGELASLLVARIPIHSCPWSANNCHTLCLFSHLFTPHISSYNIYTSTMPVVLVGHSNSSNPRGGTPFWYLSSDHLKTSLGLFVLRICRKVTSVPLFLLRLAWLDAKRVLRNIEAALCVFLTEHSIAYHSSTRQGNFFTSIAAKGPLVLVTYWD